MGGPIVRSGATPEFSKNWDSIFGGQKAGKKAVKKSGKKAASIKKAKPARAAGNSKTKLAAAGKKSGKK